MHPFILFLDFDGVLHPGCSGTVRYAPQLEAVLARFPGVRVVISSTWRCSNTLEELRGWFSREFGSRIIDVTPQLGESRASRQREIEQWLRIHPTQRWLALDDEAVLFEPGCPDLFLTNTKNALDREALQKLEARLVQAGAH